MAYLNKAEAKATCQRRPLRSLLPDLRTRAVLTQSSIVFCILRIEQPGSVQEVQGFSRCHCATLLQCSLGFRCIFPNSMQNQGCFGSVPTCAVQTPTILLLDKLSASTNSSTIFDFTGIAGICILSSMPGAELSTWASRCHVCALADFVRLFSQMPAQHAPGKLLSQRSLTQFAASYHHEHSCRAPGMPPDRIIKITHLRSQWTEYASCMTCSR